MSEPVLDAADRRILAALRADGRLSNARLAEQVGLSPTPVWNRVRRLEEQRVITGYAAQIDQKALGLADTVFIEITLDRHDMGLVRDFGERLARMKEVLELFMVSGDYDYLARIAVDGTAGYEVFLRERLYGLPGVRHCRSVFTLRTLKRDTSPDPS
jgi:Lrp/AsnC family leucine-responsive transcriptional regulator